MSEDLNDVASNDVRGRDAQARAQGGAHTYGYVAVSGLCVLKRPGCMEVSSTMCHERYVCIPCLHLHKHELERDGVGMIFRGQVTSQFEPEAVSDVPTMKDAREIEFRGVLKVLHELYAVAVDTGGQSEEEAEIVFSRAREVLSDYDIEV